ncbi:putative oxidoreductase [Pigmentiphaga humi]|uniref:Putative oxidoreductase n=1 Tax=Pigmentiphaga humi TaxID=2478468 RepID=A0A3P4BA76_9BURK|nr:SDR family oxidoreductase [Pigmentiphaga humi]VCU72436.1 putative oxidoreductase [Pigmentiphaga humi]
MAGILKGRSVLVTGASAGIGRATALALARAGADVLVTGRRQAELDEVAALCARAGGAGRALRGDLTDKGFVRELGQAANGVDVLVNNAGILTYAPIRDASVEDCEAMFRSNVVAAFAVAQEIALGMMKRRHGHLVFVTSLSARNVNSMAASYAATKHALSAYAKGFRVEMKSFGIKVTEVAPGMVDTHIRDDSTHPEVLKSIAARKFAPLMPEDVADAIVYAVSTREGCCPDLIELRPTDN